VTHQLQDAFYIATHEALRQNGNVSIVAADRHKLAEAEFIMLRDGRVYFKGRAEELRTSNDPYLKSFLSGWVPSLFD
jgi:ABC-type transporter Mla maintaining outer membrane lipid asymmetry ATPase subunit MlaF